MASRYSKEILKHPTKAIVLEDNIWEFGKAKEKAKINIPVLMPLQEPAETTKVTTRKTNKKIKNKKVERTVNYVEIYLPDSVYTYPTTADIPNDNPTLIGASKNNPKNTGENGETKRGLTRIVKKNTMLTVLIIDSIALADNIKVLGKYDDYDEPKLLEGNTGGMSALTIASAIGRDTVSTIKKIIPWR